MKLQKTVLAAALAGAIGSAGLAHSAVIQGITVADGAIFEFVLLAEGEQAGTGNGNSIIDVVGESLNGVLRVEEITDLDGNVIWEDSDSRELTGYFYDYVAQEIIIDATSGEVTILFSGGIIDLYSDGTPNFERNGTMADDIAKATDSEFAEKWLTLVGSPIGDTALPGDPTGGGNVITLLSTGESLSGPGDSVSGFGLLDVTGGAAAAILNTNTFNCTSAAEDGPCPDDADKLFTSSGQLRTPNATNDWGFLGTGEVQDVARIPEPGTVALLGLGLAGMGFSARRKLKA
jgi:hypothetical protein